MGLVRHDQSLAPVPRSDGRTWEGVSQHAERGAVPVPVQIKQMLRKGIDELEST